MRTFKRLLGPFLVLSTALLLPATVAAQPNLDLKKQADSWLWHPGALDGKAKYFLPKSLLLAQTKDQPAEIRLVKYNQPRTEASSDNEPQERNQGGYLSLRLAAPLPPGPQGQFVPFIWKAVEVRTPITPPKQNSLEYPPSLQSVEIIPLKRDEVDLLLSAVEKSKARFLPIQLKCHVVYGGYYAFEQAQTFAVEHKKFTAAFRAVAGQQDYMEVSDTQIERLIGACMDNGAITPKPVGDLSSRAAQSLFSLVRKEWLRYRLLTPARVSLESSRLVVTPGKKIAADTLKVTLLAWSYVERTLLLPVELKDEEALFKTEEVSFGSLAKPIGQRVHFKSFASAREEKKVSELLVEVVYEEPTKNYKVEKVLTFAGQEDELTWHLQVRFPLGAILKYRVTATIGAVENQEIRETAFIRVEELYVPDTAPIFLDLEQLFPAVPAPPSKPAGER